ncbi:MULTISPECIES: PP2C family protein-serine/threonine phosphatase [unclassified Streptomyces]|uniref:PP2C family protein-serine/threonine phosphatase n=1 Tax=Streptomyces TaxID=1883 RepID=UPI0006AE9512|nr:MULTISPECIES: GAF domain-containing SpoIIE family protein phosphatase [unclassified Streptomyces]KOU81445.1 phosphatase [Streptomyces sp. XY593]KOU92543.1 phosphatase [Streptomyces sp. XY533]KOU98789.1 phosphatase [Streptomyces sp. XY511]QNE25962.1 serine/threonine-protein phosphatase [Streptomyces sp. INR7]
MTVGGRTDPDRSEGFGEGLLGVLLDGAHELPPHLVGPLVAETVARMGGRESQILLQDYGQQQLVPLPADGDTAGDPQPIDRSEAGRCFLESRPVEVQTPDGIRVHMPLLDGGDQVGVLAVTLDGVDDDTRRLLRRIAGLAADLLQTKNGYTDLFFRTRRSEPMSVAAEIQWSLLPPLSMVMPHVAVAGVLEPAYAVAGDSFDYALNGDVLHLAMVDAMGHGLDAATMATVAIGAYRHARRISIELSEIYLFMDRAVAEQFDPDHFVTAQMMRLDTDTGRLQWVNAGHPAPMLIRAHRVVRRLDSPTTLPVGFGGDQPQVSAVALEPGDRVLCFTDGLIEEHETGQEQFGEKQLIDWVNQLEQGDHGIRTVARDLSHTLKRARGETTSDDASLVLFEWRG